MHLCLQPENVLIKVDQSSKVGLVAKITGTVLVIPARTPPFACLRKDEELCPICKGLSCWQVCSESFGPLQILQHWTAHHRTGKLLHCLCK